MYSSSEDKEIVRRVFEALVAVDADSMNELLSNDFVAHSMPSGFSEDKRGFIELSSHWAAGFSDDDTTLDEVLAAEDGKVVTRFTTRATHTSEVFGVPASNRSVTFTGIEIYSVADGQVTDWWAEINMDDLFNPAHEVTSPDEQDIRVNRLSE